MTSEKKKQELLAKKKKQSEEKVLTKSIQDLYEKKEVEDNTTTKVYVIED